MTAVELQTPYEPLPQQQRFRSSDAKIRGYGGAMGGGKSRAICEEAFELAIEHPGLVVLVCRQEHTSIVQTTKKTMVEEVLPAELLSHPLTQSKASQGEDWIKLPNRSSFHFIGLSDPVRWFSAEVGLLVIDQAEECDEETVAKMITRLRQRCRDCQKNPVRGEDGRVRGCTHMPNKVVLSFNPENPGHWLQRWFITGASQTLYGFRKQELYLTDARRPIGDSEFIFASPRDNPYLSADYIETLEGMQEHLRKRYLEGVWDFISGKSFFDTAALAYYQTQVRQPKWVGTTDGAPGETCRIRPSSSGPLQVWMAPVRGREDEDGRLHPPHRYIISVDVSSGGSKDYSAIQVVSIETFEQVAEYQAMTDPDLLALEAYRLGKVYNQALIAPEITGGWGFTIIKELQRLRYPRIYTRPVLDRLTNKWTDRLGWDTNSKTRAHMLDTTERVLREKDFTLNGARTLNELATFVRDENGKPQAQPGCTDDLVISLCMAVTLATQLPKQLKAVIEKPHEPMHAATGY